MLQNKQPSFDVVQFNKIRKTKNNMKNKAKKTLIYRFFGLKKIKNFCERKREKVRERKRERERKTERLKASLRNGNL